MLSKLSQQKKNDAGFTIIELLIVVVIIGILAAVAVPAYTRYIIVSRASEAPQVIGSIITYAKSYTEAHGGLPADNPTWWHDFTPYGNGSGDYFDYTYTAAGVVQAEGNGGVNDDITNADKLYYDLSNKVWTAEGVMASVMPSS